MLLFVAGLISMSCVTLSVLSANDGRDALLYKVDIFLPPKEGRDEIADILHIQETVKDLSDIDVLFSFKWVNRWKGIDYLHIIEDIVLYKIDFFVEQELGNPRIILVLDVEKACRWPKLTGFLSSKGYEYRVTSLYHVSDFAQELGVNLSSDLWATSFENHRLVMDRVVFPEKVLDVEKACRWPKLTGFLSSKGYEYRVTSLYHVSDFAQELGVNLSSDLWATSFENHRLVMDRVVFPEKDLSTLEYNEMLKWTLERDAAIARTGQQMTVFRALGEYPLELIYFGPVTQHRIEEYEEYLHGPRDFENVLTRIENLDHYTGQCQGD